MEAMEAMFTTEPPPALLIAGMQALVPRNTPSAFTSMTRFQVSRSRSSTVLRS